MTNTMIRSECGRILRSGGASAEGRAFPAVLSTGLPARDNHAVNPAGWVLPPSKTVPFLNGHLDQQQGIRSVIGKVIDLHTDYAELEDGREVKALLGTVVYAPESISEEAEQAYQLARAGFCTGLSVSFLPGQWTFALQRGPGAMDISSAELLEVSAVPVGSDPDARVLARALGARSRGEATREQRILIARALRARVARDDGGTTPTLAGLGYGGHKVRDAALEAHSTLGRHLTTALDAVKRAKRKLPDDHIAYAPLLNAHAAISRAQDAHQALGDALSETDPVPDDVTAAGRAARVARARELVLVERDPLAAGNPEAAALRATDR